MSSSSSLTTPKMLDSIFKRRQLFLSPQNTLQAAVGKKAIQTPKPSDMYLSFDTQFRQKAPLLLLDTMENTKDELIIKLTEDGKVTKRIIKEGIGMQPDKYSTVTVHFDSFVVKSGKKFDSSRDRQMPLTFDLSAEKDQVIKGWEIAIPTMKIGEVAEIVCSHKYAYGEQGFYPLVPPKSKVRGQIELLSAYNRVDKARERLDTAIVKKEEGSKFFKLNELEIALFAYYAARKYVIDLWDCSPEELEECRVLTVAIQLNIGACYIKQRRWDDAVEVLNYVLARDPKNVKAFYRLGQVCMEQLEYEQGCLVVKQGLKVLPKDPHLTGLLNTLEEKSKSSLKSSAQVYRKMFG